jgi:LPXTG-motif cell wall-anchored protein
MITYANCDEVRAAGAAPIYKTSPGYAPHLDADGDGWGCDTDIHGSPIPHPSVPVSSPTPTPSVTATATPTTAPARTSVGVPTSTASAKQGIVSLPVTGTGATWLIVGALLIAVGAVCLILTRRRLSR